MIARVRGPIRASTAARSMLRVTRSQSTNTGVARARTIMFRTVKKLWPQVITSSPGPISASCSATSTAAVADVSTRTGRPSQNSDSAASKRSTKMPLAMWPERSTSPAAAIDASSSNGLANFSGCVPPTLAAVAAALPPGGAQFAPWDGPAALMVPLRSPSTTRDEKDAGDDEADPEPALHRHRFAEQVMRGNRVDDIAERQHRVRDGHRHARKSDDPYDQADAIEGHAGDEVAFACHAGQRRSPVVGGQRDDAEPVRDRLQQQLRGGVQQHAGDEEQEGVEGHHDSAARNEHAACVRGDDAHRHAGGGER